MWCSNKAYFIPYLLSPFTCRFIISIQIHLMYFESFKSLKVRIVRMYSQKYETNTADLASIPVSMIITNFCAAACFQVNLNLLWWYFSLKGESYLKTVTRFLSCHQSRRCLRKLHIANIMINLLHPMRFCDGHCGLRKMIHNSLLPL